MASPPFDPTSAHFLADPYRAYAELRNAALARGGAAVPGLVRVGAPYDAWWVTSHALVTQVCDDPDVFASWRPAHRRHGFRHHRARRWLFFLSGDRRRRRDGGVFGPRSEAPKRARRRSRPARRQALAAGCDLVRDYAAKLATTVFMALLGIPGPEQGPAHAVERLIVDGWLRLMLARHDKTLHPLLRAEGATASMALRTYLQLRGNELRDEKDDGSILAGIAQRITGPGKAPGSDELSPDEAINTAAHFALGGYLSTEFLIGSGILNLLRHPGPWALLQKEPDRLGAAIDEMLRFDAPFQMADRWVDNDADLGGQKIPAGSRVVVAYGAANRDPAAFSDPDRFDITRSDAGGHYGFGHGPHRCIGAAHRRRRRGAHAARSCAVGAAGRGRTLGQQPVLPRVDARRVAVQMMSPPAPSVLRFDNSAEFDRAAGELASTAATRRWGRVPLRC